MPLEDATPLPAAPPTRRTILRTGVKLAYAAPVVAASMTLSAEHSAAAVSGPVTTGVIRNCTCSGATPSGSVCAPSCDADIHALCAAFCDPDDVVDAWECLPISVPCTL